MRRDRCDAGGPNVTQHIQCGGGRRGPSLGFIGGEKIWEIQQQQKYDAAEREEDSGKQQHKTANRGGPYLSEGEGIVFYADDRMVASTNPGWIHTAFDTLMGLFGRVGLGKMLRRLWGWCATHAVRKEYVHMKPIPGG